MVSAITGKEVNNNKKNELIDTTPINISKKIKFKLSENEIDINENNNSNIERIWAYLKLTNLQKIN